MKRFALTLAAFALTGALAFADDMAPVAKISGEVNNGVILTSNSSANYLKNYGIDYGSGNAGPTVLLAADLAAANFGYSIAFAYKGTGGDSIDHAYGWVKPSDSVEVYAGASGNNAPFGDLDDNGAGDYSTSSVGAFYSANGISVGAQIVPQALLAVNGVIPGTTAVPVWIGARYALDKVVTLNVYGSNDATNQVNRVHATASLLAVTGLTLTGGYNSDSIAATTNAAFFDATAAYAVTDAFTAGATVYYDTNVADPTTAKYSAFLVYKPYVSFAAVPGMLAVNAYFIGDTSGTPNYEPEGQLAWTPVAGVTIKATAWYDTALTGIGYAGIHSNYTGVADKSKDSAFSAALDAKFAF